MATDILVPTLGESVTEATIAQWLKQPGEAVADRPLSGAIELIDPRPAVTVYDIPGIPQFSTWTIRPEAGMMLMFPSWLRHGVLPYEGTKERLTIAFNIRIQDLTREPPGSQS